MLLQIIAGTDTALIRDYFSLIDIIHKLYWYMQNINIHVSTHVKQRITTNKIFLLIMLRIKNNLWTSAYFSFQNKNISIQEVCRYNFSNKECIETAGSENCDSYSLSEHAGIKTIN